MSHRSLVCSLAAALIAAGLLAVPTSEAHSKWKRHHPSPPSPPPPMLRNAVVEVGADLVKVWASSCRGDEVGIPWFDESTLDAVVERVEPSGDLLNVHARVPGTLPGTAVLTLGDGDLVGALNVEGQTYRLRRLEADRYALSQIDTNSLMPDALDTSEDGPRFFPRGGRLFDVQQLPEFLLRPIVRRLFEVQQDQVLMLRNSGRQIDVLIAYSTEVADWAQGRGMNLALEIENMVADTNTAFQESGVQTQLRVVHQTMVDHDVVDPVTLEADDIQLREGTGGLGGLHALRDQHGADLVSLLVLNGPDASCGRDDDRACGYAEVPRRFPLPGEQPGSPSWTAYYDPRGFAVMHAPAAFDAHTFKHEIAHNLGAHHDTLTFVQDGTAATADPFARGWIVSPYLVRTIMAYNRQCETFLAADCAVVPWYSNPSLTYGSPPLPLGNPTGSVNPYLAPPADNVQAMNRMLFTVANYRIRTF
jgi:Metallo-peptidase family M12